MSPSRPGPSGLPGKQEILDFIKQSQGRVGRREIARAFSIKANGKIALKALLKEMKEEGLIDKGRGRSLADPATLPPVTTIEVTGVDADGELMGRPTVWHADTPPPPIYMAPERQGRPALGVGDRVLAKIRKTGDAGDNAFEAQTIRVIAGAPQQILGVFHVMDKKDRGDGQIESTDRRHKSAFVVDRTDFGGAIEGELVVAQSAPGRHKGLPRARITERLGHTGDPGAISLVAIHSHDIPVDFPQEALTQARNAKPVLRADGRKGREDLTGIPLVTIDGADARDFDDAVYAHADDNPENPGGWNLLVAIADVAHYVRANDPLDREARKRGNSTYFPDRVVPMLPEELSNNLCSLRPNEDRPCLAAHMTIDAGGHLLGHKFVRGLMRSAARLTYEEVQAARNGKGSEKTDALMETVITPLYGAYASLLKARQARGALELDLPERKVVLGEDGHIRSIEPRERLDSHKLIEEFMIAANVAAAQTLGQKKRPCLYRVHEPPAPAKVESLRDFIKGFGYNLSRGQVLKPEHFTQILEKAANSDHSHLISEIVLRSQSKADYRPENLSHFGLALRNYAHFTSPIRRYADLVVHRSLIDTLSLGSAPGSKGPPEDGLGEIDGDTLAETAEHISQTERRSATAERDAFDRYTVSFLQDRVGAKFKGRINGVTRFGLFVTLNETGADGLVPARTMSDDYYIHDEDRHCLRGRHSGKTYTLGEDVTVTLAEANPVTGGMVFELVEEGGTSARRPGRGPGRQPGGRKGKPGGYPKKGKKKPGKKGKNTGKR